MSDDIVWDFFEHHLNKLKSKGLDGERNGSLTLAAAILTLADMLVTEEEN